MHYTFPEMIDLDCSSVILWCDRSYVRMTRAVHPLLVYIITTGILLFIIIIVFVDILSFCSLSVLFCLFLHPPSLIFYVFLFLSFVLSLITCTIFIGDTITTIPCLFNYKCLMFKSTLIVV